MENVSVEQLDACLHEDILLGVETSAKLVRHAFGI